MLAYNDMIRNISQRNIYQLIRKASFVYIVFYLSTKSTLKRHLCQATFFSMRTLKLFYETVFV